MEGENKFVVDWSIRKSVLLRTGKGKTVERVLRSEK